MTDRDFIDKLLKFDPLLQAEKETGKSYKEDEDTNSLGLGMMLMNNEFKARALRDSGDTVFSSKLTDYLEVVVALGFECVLKVPFQREADGKKIDNMMFVFWHPDGILLKFDTFSWGAGDLTINSSNFYYNWKPSVENRWEFTSSGKYHWPEEERKNEDFKPEIWVGYHDGREALKHKIEGLRQNGEFLSEWIENPIYSLTHYEDVPRHVRDSWDYKTRQDAYKKIADERYAQLPEHVRKAIGVEKE